MAEMDEEDDSCGNIGTNRYQAMPSLQALQQMRNRLHTAFLGKRLMKWTALATGKELRKISGLLNMSQEGTYVTEYQQAMMELARCRYYNTEFYKVLLEDLGPEAHVTCTTTPKFIAGTKIMLIEMHEDGPVYEPYSCLGLGGEMLRKTRETWRNLLKDLILITQLRCSFSIVYKSNRDATKKKNVMQKIIIPKTINTIRYILSELEEMEREDFYRLKKIKNLKNKAKEGEVIFRRVDPPAEAKYVCHKICPISYPYYVAEPKTPTGESDQAVIGSDPKKAGICDIPKRSTPKVPRVVDLAEAMKLKPSVVKQILPPPFNFNDEEDEDTFPCQICKIVEVSQRNEEPSKKVQVLETPSVSHPQMINKIKMEIEEEFNTALDISIKNAEYLLAPVIHEIDSDDLTEMINMVTRGLSPAPRYEGEPDKNFITKTAGKSVKDVLAFLDNMLIFSGINSQRSTVVKKSESEKCKNSCGVLKDNIPDLDLTKSDSLTKNEKDLIPVNDNNDDEVCIPTCETKLFKKEDDECNCRSCEVSNGVAKDKISGLDLTKLECLIKNQLISAPVNENDKEAVYLRVFIKESEEVFKAVSHQVQVGQISTLTETGQYSDQFIGEEIKEVTKTTRIYDKDGNIVHEKMETSITTAPLQERMKEEAISGRCSNFIEFLAKMTSTSATCAIPEDYPKDNDNLLKLPATLFADTSIQDASSPFTVSSQCIRDKEQPKPRVCGSCVIQLPRKPKGWSDAGEVLSKKKSQTKGKRAKKIGENQTKRLGRDASKLRRQADEEVEIKTNTYADFIKASVKSCGVSCEKSFCMILDCCKKKKLCIYPCDLESCSCEECEFRKKQ